MKTPRPAVTEDLPRIRELVRAAQINPTGLDWQRFAVIVNFDQQVIACAQIKPHRDGSRELASLVVDPAYRNQGLARTLIAHLIRQYEGDLHLMCRASLGGFYAKFGFEPLSEPEMPPYFRRINRLASLIESLQKEGETLLVMRRQG